MAKEPSKAFNKLLRSFQKATQRGDIEAEEAIGLQALALASEEMSKEPSADLRLKMEAHEHEFRGEWEDAEKAYQQCIDLAKSENNSMALYKAHEDLAGLYGLLDEREKQWEQTSFALRAARDSDMSILMSMALQSTGTSQLEQGNIDAALLSADEVIQLSTKTFKDDLGAARGHILRAACFAKQGKRAEAESELNEAWPTIAPRSQATTLAGYQSALASWWRTTAQIQLDAGDTQEAVAAMRKSVDFARNIAMALQLEGPYKFNQLAKSLHRYAKFLRDSNDAAGAQQAAEESVAIRQALKLPILTD
jgi:tetratricopeptide (TPR) repeat protein